MHSTAGIQGWDLVLLCIGISCGVHGSVRVLLPGSTQLVLLSSALAPERHSNHAGIQQGGGLRRSTGTYPVVKAGRSQHASFVCCTKSRGGCRGVEVHVELLHHSA